MGNMDKNENLTNDELIHIYIGIRPAPGYPASRSYAKRGSF